MNGVSAIDGGFLQILMTAATGQTEIEIAASKGCLGGYENIPDELKHLRVRFGELVTQESVHKSAETSSLPLVTTNDVGRGMYGDEPGEDATLMITSQESEGRESQGHEVSGAAMASGIGDRVQDKEGALTRRAAFGVSDEITSLRKGV